MYGCPALRRACLAMTVGLGSILSCWHAKSASLEALQEADAVDVEWGAQIPLRDGVRLSATVYRPHHQTAPRPCLFTLTPYIAQTYHDRGMYFAAHGYPFLTVDVRGRGNSEGVFRPLIQESNDGFDVVEWLAKQTYCNGKVSMWGGSYAGYDQWATAKARPPHLATIVPVAAPFMMIDFPGRNNMLQPYDIQWLTLVGGQASQASIFADDAFWSTLYRRWHESGRPFSELDRIAGNRSSIFQEWAAHPDSGAYWDAYNPTADEYAKLDIPILTITGIYDGDQPGALEHYRRYMASASPAGRARHYLVIGPWDHAGTRTPKDEVGGLKFGPASLVDLPQLHLDWYRWTMENGAKPAFLKKPVVYYVTGAERWRDADSLEAITGDTRRYFLSSSGAGAGDVYSPGALSRAPKPAPPDTYRYDPREPTLAAIETTLDENTLLDQRVQNTNRSQLVYQSPPLAADTEVAGFFHLTTFIGIDQPDTDFVVSIYEVSIDGKVLLLTTDQQRARYRESTRNPTFVHTRAPLRYDFNHFMFTSRLLPKGSRLRLIVSAANSMYQETNYNTDGTVEAETQQDGRPVTVELYHDAAHASELRVPIAAQAATVSK